MNHPLSFIGNNSDRTDIRQVSSTNPLPVTGTGGAMGNTTDTAATDDTGTWSLIALFKRLLSKISGVLVNSGTVVAAAGQSAVIVISQTVTAAAYATGNAIGGKITLANAVQVTAGSALLHHLMILDRSNTKPAGDILIFNADPTNATITDKAAFVFSTEDLKVVARIPVSAADYKTINSKALAAFPNLGRLCKATSGTSLFAAFVADGTSNPTFAATTDLQLIFKFIPNSN